VTEADREYVMHFITLDLELAVADAALGRADDAIHRIDGLLRRYEESRHPLALGLLHETRAHIAWVAGKVEEYERSLHETERWFLPTKEPALIAKCKRLEERRGEAARETADRSPGRATGASVSGARELERTVVSGRARRTSEG
jgi:hypothetical protein